jgi:hypothetical protein
MPIRLTSRQNLAQAQLRWIVDAPAELELEPIRSEMLAMNPVDETNSRTTEVQQRLDM